MSKVMLLVLFSINILATSGELTLMESILDKLATQLFPIADTSNLAVDDMGKMKTYCEKTDKTFFSGQNDKLAQVFKGIVLDVVERMINQLAVDGRRDIPVCSLLKQDQFEKASKMVEEMNKQSAEGQKIRFGLLTILDDVINNKETKTTFPILTCYLKQYCDKLVSVYPDEHGAKQNVKAIIDAVFNEIIAVLEEKKGKASDNCELKEASSNPSEYNSVLAVIKAISALDK